MIEIIGKKLLLFNKTYKTNLSIVLKGSYASKIQGLLDRKSNDIDFCFTTSSSLKDKINFMDFLEKELKICFLTNDQNLKQFIYSNVRYEFILLEDIDKIYCKHSNWDNIFILKPIYLLIQKISSFPYILSSDYKHNKRKKLLDSIKDIEHYLKCINLNEELKDNLTNSFIFLCLYNSFFIFKYYKYTEFHIKLSNIDSLISIQEYKVHMKTLNKIVNIHNFLFSEKEKFIKFLDCILMNNELITNSIREKQSLPTLPFFEFEAIRKLFEHHLSINNAIYFEKYNLNISIDVSENNNWEEDKLLIQVDEQNKDTINNIIDIIKNKLKMFSLPYELSLSLVSKKVIKTQHKNNISISLPSSKIHSTSSNVLIKNFYYLMFFIFLLNEDFND